MNRHSVKSRTQYSAEGRAEVVARFRSSGLTQQAFAQQEGLKWTTFRNWLYERRKAKTRSVAPVRLQELDLGRLLPSHPWGAEIALSNGTVVRVKAGADPAWVQAILQPLSQPC
jgi:hypothetical protein